ncbi:MAG: hypothetical protein ACXVPX_06525, partial [Actinomycetota bacterium]
DHRVLALYATRLGSGFAIGVVALLPVLAISHFHSGNRGTGLLFAFRGIGSLIGPFLARPPIVAEPQAVVRGGDLDRRPEASCGWWTDSIARPWPSGRAWTPRTSTD